jgi:hypothetical protein
MMNRDGSRERPAMKANNESFHLWTNVAVFDNPDDATRLADFLKAEGFESRVHDERKLQRYWFLAEQQAGVHTQVTQKQFEAVEQRLDNAPNSPSLLANAIRCPSCKSLRVEYPQMTRKFVLPTLVAQVLVVLGLMKRECYCETCQYTWVRHTPAYVGMSQPAKAR